MTSLPLVISPYSFLLLLLFSRHVKDKTTFSISISVTNLCVSSIWTHSMRTKKKREFTSFAALNHSMATTLSDLHDSTLHIRLRIGLCISVSELVYVSRFNRSLICGYFVFCRVPPVISNGSAATADDDNNYRRNRNNNNICYYH